MYILRGENKSSFIIRQDSDASPYHGYIYDPHPTFAKSRRLRLTHRFVDSIDYKWIGTFVRDILKGEEKWVDFIANTVSMLNVASQNVLVLVGISV